MKIPILIVTGLVACVFILAIVLVGCPSEVK